jgi:hypothetical protein
LRAALEASSRRWMVSREFKCQKARGAQGAYGAAGPAYVAPLSQGFGYFGDTDPDPQDREELMRDPPNDR